MDVAFEYDMLGRLLRRVSGIDETLFEWDGWDLVRETAPDGTVTRYFWPEGELHRFQRDSEYYSVHSDALGSVRMITDAAGRVVSTHQYGAWGNVMELSTDGVPGGFPYRFVGALGCRADDEIGLVYMRSRWCDVAVLGQFSHKVWTSFQGALHRTASPHKNSFGDHGDRARMAPSSHSDSCILGAIR